MHFSKTSGKLTWPELRNLPHKRMQCINIIWTILCAKCVLIFIHTYVFNNEFFALKKIIMQKKSTRNKIQWVEYFVDVSQIFGKQMIQYLKQRSHEEWSILERRLNLSSALMVYAINVTFKTKIFRNYLQILFIFKIYRKNP